MLPVGKFEGKTVHMRTIIMGDPSSPKLVFLHGYCGSGSLFFKIFKPLSEHVCLIMVDHIGMGCSDHPQDYKRDFTYQECIDYFVNYFESWRLAMSNSKSVQALIGCKELTNFYLCGHSFGGYVAGNYSCRFKHHVKKLILVSPVGIRDLDEAEEETQKPSEFESGVLD